MLRRELGGDWSGFVAEWYLGVEPDAPESVIREAFEALDRYYPEYLDNLITSCRRGVAFVAPAVDLGRALAHCVPMKGFGHVLRGIRAGNRSALAQLEFATTLKELGLEVTLEPELEGKHPDLAVSANGERVYVEVVAPELSAISKRGTQRIQHLANALIADSLGSEIEVLLLGDPTESQIDEIVECASSLPTPSEEIGLGTIARIRKDQCVGTPMIGPRIQDNSLMSLVSVGLVRSRNGVPGTISVRLPMTDERAAAMVARELHHFSREYANILVIDLTGVGGSRRDWGHLFRNALLPDLNRKVSAIILVYSGLVSSSTDVIRNWHVIRNTHALKPAPGSLLERIEALNTRMPAIS
jgi:hypothetical protein